MSAHMWIVILGLQLHCIHFYITFAANYIAFLASIDIVREGETPNHIWYSWLYWHTCTDTNWNDCTDTALVLLMIMLTFTYNGGDNYNDVYSIFTTSRNT